VAVAWLAGLAAIGAWVASQHGGWDFRIYCNAIQSLHRGHDPYADAIAVEDEFHRTLAQHPNATTPFSYIYPPITLPLLRLAGAFPAPVSVALYWLAYCAAAGALVWIGLQAAGTGERHFFLCFAPFAVFFPGLLQHDAILSGNLGIILYAVVLGAAVTGWRRDRWALCYVAIVAASCFKPPLLTLVAIPLLSARRQLWRSAVTVACGTVLFAMQPFLWPSLFRNFLHAVALQFVYYRDFGCSPAGLLSSFLVAHGLSHSPWSTLFYLAYAPVIFAVLLVVSRRFIAREIDLPQFLPVLLTGVILLNPRIMQYDTLPLTIPMLLLAWRALRRVMTRVWTVVSMCAFLAAANLVAVQSLEWWKDVEGPLLIVLFAAGCWELQGRVGRSAIRCGRGGS
jgi:hypothetical protein